MVRPVRVVSIDGAIGRLLEMGVGKPTTSELLAIIFEGNSINRGEAESIAGAINTGGLASAAAKPDELAILSEFGPVATAVLMAAFELSRRAGLPALPAVVRSRDDVAAIARRELGGLPRERVIVIVCDAMNRCQRTVTVSDGATDRSLMPVREILNAVLRWDGCAFAVAHNHPGGDPEPSNADIETTRQLAEAARVVGLRFLGHMVVAGHRHQAVGELSATRTPG
jgi:DNA repair protein RadC